MADTFKGIITVDGKKRQLPYGSVLDKPVANKTLDIEGAFADAKVVGDKFKAVKAETDSLKEDLTQVSESISEISDELHGIDVKPFKQYFYITEPKNYVSDLYVEKGTTYILRKLTGQYYDGFATNTVSAFVQGNTSVSVSFGGILKEVEFTPSTSGKLVLYKGGTSATTPAIITLEVRKKGVEYPKTDYVFENENLPIVNTENTFRNKAYGLSSKMMVESTSPYWSYFKIKTDGIKAFHVSKVGYWILKVYEDGSFDAEFTQDNKNTEKDITVVNGVTEVIINWLSNADKETEVADMDGNIIGGSAYAPFEKSKAMFLHDNAFPIVSTTEIISDGNNKKVIQKDRNAWKYPLTPTWGNEYLAPWYEKLFNEVSVVIDLEGDSVTQGENGGYRKKFIEKIMRIGGYSNFTVFNNGKGSRSTNEWVGTGNYYAKDSDHTDFPLGILDVGMTQNPDIMICAYGLNDSVIDTTNLTVKQRLDIFETNYREALERIRGSEPVNGRPAYNRSADDLCIILCMPTTCKESAHPDRSKDKWHIYVKEIIMNLCREYHCAFCDFSYFMFDHNWSDCWGSKNPTYSPPTLHPSPSYTMAYTSLIQPMLFPIGLWVESSN